MTELLYKPSAWGAAYHALPHTEALGAGSVGPGKTQVLIHEPLPQIQVEHARCVGKPELVAQPGQWLYDAVKDNPLRWGMSKGWALHLRRTLPMLLQTIERCKHIFFSLDEGVKWEQSNLRFIFPSGYKYQFGHCNEVGDWQNYYSSEYTMVCFDELTAFAEVQYDQISSRCRTTDPVLQRMLKVRSMSNPNQQQEGNAKVPNPHWVRERFVDPAPEGKVTLEKKIKLSDGTEKKLTRIYLPAKLSDNPDKEFVKAYEARLLNLPPHIQRALIDGDWYVTAGSFFAEAWQPDIHICRPFAIPDGWKQFRSMDWGFKNPGCVHWGALDEDDNLYIQREYTFKGKTIEQVAEGIIEIEKMMGLWHNGRSRIQGWADTQLWEERGDVGLSKAAIMQKMGIPWRRADKKSRKTNALRVMARLLDHDNQTTTPGMVIFNRCPKLIKTLPGIPTDKDDPELPADGGDDHWFDSACYMVAGVSHGSKGVPSMLDDDEDYDEGPSGGRGRFGYGSALG